MRRRIYLALALILALVAAVMTMRAQHTVSVVVANHNVSAGTQLAPADLRIEAIHEGDFPAGALTNTTAAAGRYVSWPLTAGEPVLSNALSNQWSGSDVVGGYSLPAGYLAVGIPVSPAGAVGGMLAAGDRVDVYATPNQSATTQPTTTEITQPNGPAPQTTLLGHDVLVLQLRNDQGQALNDTSAASSSNSSVHGLNFGSGKLGSIVVAVPNTQVAEFAAAASADTLYVALSVS